MMAVRSVKFNMIEYLAPSYCQQTWTTQANAKVHPGQKEVVKPKRKKTEQKQSLPIGYTVNGRTFSNMDDAIIELRGTEATQIRYNLGEIQGIMYRNELVDECTHQFRQETKYSANRNPKQFFPL